MSKPLTVLCNINVYVCSLQCLDNLLLSNKLSVFLSIGSFWFLGTALIVFGGVTCDNDKQTATPYGVCKKMFRTISSCNRVRVNCILKTYLSILAISLTASTPPGRGSSSMKKSLDSQILMAFSWNKKNSNNNNKMHPHTLVRVLSK